MRWFPRHRVCDNETHNALQLSREDKFSETSICLSCHCLGTRTRADVLPRSSGSRRNRSFALLQLRSVKSLQRQRHCFAKESINRIKIGQSPCCLPHRKSSVRPKHKPAAISEVVSPLSGMNDPLDLDTLSPTPCLQKKVWALAAGRIPNPALQG